MYVGDATEAIDLLQTSLFQSTYNDLEERIEWEMKRKDQMMRNCTSFLSGVQMMREMYSRTATEMRGNN